MRRTPAPPRGGSRPRKRPARPELPDDPLARAKARYIASRVSLKELAEEFKGLPGCGLSQLGARSGEEGWVEERERYRDRVVTESTAIVGHEQAERDARHLTAMRDAIEVQATATALVRDQLARVRELTAAKEIKPGDAITALSMLSLAAKNLTQAQVAAIMLERTLGTTEGSEWRTFESEVESLWSDIQSRRDELIKRAELAAAAEKPRRRRAANGGD